MQTRGQTLDRSRLPRIAAIDAARGVALIAMTMFHFGWDLEMFGFAERGFATHPAMVWFARLIATSFLFLVGVSLVLAHESGFNRRGYLRRLAMVGGAALAITTATWFATPDVYIFFGILHHIAVASIIGLIFLAFPWWVAALAAMGVLLAREYGRTANLDGMAWWWTGLTASTPRSTDFVPLFPFFAAVLAGIAAAKLAGRFGVWDRLAKWRGNRFPASVFIFLGRHSLAYYLIHQPVLIAVLFGLQWITR